MKTKLLPNTGHQIFFGLVIALIFVVAIEGAMDLESECGFGWHYSSTVDVGEVTRLSIRRGGCRLKVKMAGDVRLTDDERNVLALPAGAYLEIDERTRDARHGFKAYPGADGEPEIEYSLDGSEQPFGVEAQAWFHDVALRLYRKAGLDAEGRVARLFQRGGADAVLTEVEEISSDNIASEYLKHLWAQDDVSELDMVASLELAGRGIGSDHTLAATLIAMPSPWLTRPEIRSALASACRSIGSDYEQRRTLGHLLDSAELDAGSLEMLLDIAQGIGSDYELASLMVQVADRYPVDLPMPSMLSSVLATIASDYEQRRAIEAFFSRSDLDGELSGQLLAAVRSIGSDSEATEVIVQFAQRLPPDQTLPASTFEAIATIHSDHSQRRALTALVERESLDEDELGALLQAAKGIGSDTELSELLIELVGRHPLGERAAEAFGATLATIGSEAARQRVAAALETAAAQPSTTAGAI